MLLGRALFDEAAPAGVFPPTRAHPFVSGRRRPRDNPLRLMPVHVFESPQTRGKRTLSLLATQTQTHKGITKEAAHTIGKGCSQQNNKAN